MLNRWRLGLCSLTVTSFLYSTNIIWRYRGNVALMEKLQVPQNKATRIILDLPPQTSATEA